MMMTAITNHSTSAEYRAFISRILRRGSAPFALSLQKIGRRRLQRWRAIKTPIARDD